jgi:hypothetical protein
VFGRTAAAPAGGPSDGRSSPRLSGRQVALLACLASVGLMLALAIGRSSLPSVIAHGWQSLVPGSTHHPSPAPDERGGTATQKRDHAVGGNAAPAAGAPAATVRTKARGDVTRHDHERGGATTQSLPVPGPAAPTPRTPGATPAAPPDPNPPTGGGGGGASGTGGGSGTTGGGSGTGGGTSTTPTVSVNVNGNSADASVDTGTGTSVGATVPVPSDPTQPSTPTVTTSTPTVTTPVATVPSVTVPGL